MDAIIISASNLNLERTEEEVIVNGVHEELIARRFVHNIYGSRDRSDPGCFIRALRRASGIFAFEARS